MPLDFAAPNSAGSSLSLEDHSAVAAWLEAIAWTGWVAWTDLNNEEIEELVGVGPVGQAPVWQLWRQMSDGRLVVACEDRGELHLVDTVAEARRVVEASKP